MRKPLVAMEGGRAVVFELPLLAIIGAEDAQELELTTDGQRLILSAPRVTPSNNVREDGLGPSNHREDNGTRYDDPKLTLSLIKELQDQYGFNQGHFRQLHHFNDRASLQQHIKYCNNTGRFTADTNVIVAKRLALCLHTLQRGRSWPEAISRAHVELPFRHGDDK